MKDVGNSNRVGEKRLRSRYTLKVSGQGQLIVYRVQEKGVGTGGIEPLTEIGMAEFGFGNVGDVSKILEWTCRIGSLIQKSEVLQK